MKKTLMDGTLQSLVKVVFSRLEKSLMEHAAFAVTLIASLKVEHLPYYF